MAEPHTDPKPLNAEETEASQLDWFDDRDAYGWGGMDSSLRMSIYRTGWARGLAYAQRDRVVEETETDAREDGVASHPIVDTSITDILPQLDEQTIVAALAAIATNHDLLIRELGRRRAEALGYTEGNKP